MKIIANTRDFFAWYCDENRDNIDRHFITDLLDSFDEKPEVIDNVIKHIDESAVVTSGEVCDPYTWAKLLTLTYSDGFSFDIEAWNLYSEQI